jgi:hypothetical protein
VGTNRHYVNLAARIRREDPDLFHEVWRGHVTINKAIKRLDTARAPKEAGQESPQAEAQAQVPPQQHGPAKTEDAPPAEPRVEPAQPTDTSPPSGDGDSSPTPGTPAPKPQDPIAAAAATAPRVAKPSRARKKKPRTDKDAERDLAQAVGLLRHLASKDAKRVGRLIREDASARWRWGEALAGAAKALKTLEEWVAAATEADAKADGGPGHAADPGGDGADDHGPDELPAPASAVEPVASAVAALAG